MAGFFQQFLNGVSNGFLGSPNLKDYQHASKTFRSNAYGNAPKFKWLFHVYFDINKRNISTNPQVFPDTTNYGLLVKSIDLPKFDIKVQELNQYNRKRFVQTKIDYQPINVSFHDDNANQVRHLWQTYYSYYYNDPLQPTKVTAGFSSPSQRADPDMATTMLNPRNLYDKSIAGNESWGYQGNISSANGMEQKTPFFNSIKIYGFNQHNFALYVLINPIIKSFSHDNYNYSESTSTMENRMTINYESVKYYDGALNGQNPEQIVNGFGNPGVYDTELSPIARPGNNKTILGQGGLLDAGTGILEDLARGNILGAAQTAGRVSRTFKNSQSILQTAKEELVKGAASAVSNPQNNRVGQYFPAVGATTGPGAQEANSKNVRSAYAPPIGSNNNAGS